jgi:hypothetical protein
MEGSGNGLIYGVVLKCLEARRKITNNLLG